MSKRDMRFAPLFSVWQIDAWAEGEGGWTWNNKIKLFEFRTNSLDVKRVFLRRLRDYAAKVNKYGGLGEGWYYVEDDWYVIELRKRCNHEPVYACIREMPSYEKVQK